MQKYNKTEWTKNNMIGSSSNMDKIEGQLELLTNESISINEKHVKTEIILNDKIKQKIDASEQVYYNEISITKKRDEVSGTTYWLTNIPHLDKQGNIIKLKTGVSEYYETNPNRHESDGTGTNYNSSPKLETARDFSIRKNATLVINGGTWGDQGANGNCAVNGEIKANVAADYQRMPLGIKADNTLKSYHYTMSVQDQIADGCIDVVPGFYPILVDGLKYSGTLTFNWTVKHPRTIIGQKDNKDIVVITCDGRATNENGMSMEDGLRLLLENNCVFGYNLDGGGSTSLIYKNQFVNNKIDSNRTQERRLYSFIYVSKEKNVDYKSKISEEIINTNISMGDLKSLIQDTMIEILNKKDFTDGYIRLKGAQDNVYQGIETWDGENKNCKLVLNKNQMRYYDYNNSRGMFNVDVDGNISTPKGTLGIFNSSPVAVTDLDTINESGIYWCLNSANNAPNECSNGIIHFNINENNKMQVAFPYTVDNEKYKVKIRRTNNTDGSWFEWKEF